MVSNPKVTKDVLHSNIKATIMLAMRKDKFWMIKTAEVVIKFLAYLQSSNNI